MVQQGVDADPVFGGDWVDVSDTQFVKLVRQLVFSRRIGLIDCQTHRFPEAQEHFGEVAIGPGYFRARVDKEDDVSGAFERHLGLAKDLAGNVLLIVNDNAAGVDEFEAAAIVLGEPVDPVARDPGFVADDGPALSGDSIEECGLADVRAAHNHHCGSGVRHGNLMIA